MTTTLIALPATRAPPLGPPTLLMTQAGISRQRVKRFPTSTMRPTSRLSSRSHNIFAVVLTVFHSNVESLKKGVITISKNKAKAPYTIVLIGETGVGKTSVLCLIANVLAGNDMDHYDFTILEHNDEQRGSNNQSQTISARLYEFTSKNGIMVRVGNVNVVNMRQNVSRFASLTHQGWATPAVFSKMSS